jgi:endonuclease III
VKQWKAARSKPSATTAKAKKSSLSKKSPLAKIKPVVKKAKKPAARKSILFSESFADRKARAAEIMLQLNKTYPDSECALLHETPEQLLIATILSAQCTDARVNMVTPGLFKKYPDAAAFAEAPIEELEQDIRSTGFYRNKAKNIKAACEILVSKYGGKVPRTLEELVVLPGVGRKTANVVLGNAFNVPGLVVDTHVGRLSYRMGLAVAKGAAIKNAEVIEREMMELIEKKDWTMVAHWLISHGRAICVARKPRCHQCPVAKFCPRIGVGDTAEY